MGVLEWDSVNNTLVHFFPNQTGYLSAAPADDKILVLFYDTPIISILEPRGVSCGQQGICIGLVSCKDPSAASARVRTCLQSRLSSQWCKSEHASLSAAASMACRS